MANPVLSYGTILGTSILWHKDNSNITSHNNNNNSTPGTNAAMQRVTAEGVMDTILRAGVYVCGPGCGMCPGFYTPLAENEVCIGSSTTNVPGRMGAESAQVYLASPATVAASAIEGKITDPRKYL